LSLRKLPGAAMARRLAIAAVLGAACVAAPPAAHAAPSGAVPGIVCGLSQRAVQESSGGVWVISRANAYDTSGQKLCIRPAPGGRPGFTVATNLRYTGLWQAYPFTGWGCAYDLCTRGANPVRVSALPRAASMSWSWRSGGAKGIWNASVDDWFSKTDQITSQDNGAELMIWLSTPEGYTGGRLVHIGHRAYWFMHWRAHHGKVSWWYVQFRTTKTVSGVRQLWLRPFLRFLERQRPRLVVPSWYLTSVHAGYELVSGGKGLQTTWFNFHA
jgi:Glycosyl hydrolase family 12